MLVAALASGTDDPHIRASLVVPAGTLQTLVGAGIPDSRRLTVTGGLPDALRLLEEQTLHRTRVLSDHEVDHAAALPAADPTAEPLPPLLLLADIDTTAGHEHTRIAALLAHGDRLNLHAVLLGPWPPGQTVTVAPDGTTTPAGNDSARHAAQTDTGRLTVLTAAEATDLATTLIEAHGDTTGPPQNPAPDAERTPSPASEATSPSPTAAQPALLDNDDPVPADTQSAVETGNGAARSDAPGDAAISRARITVLGRPGIDDSTAEPGDPLRPKSLELLVYLAVHGGSARVETILEDLLPDAPARKAPYRLHTYVYSLRKTLHRCAGPGTYLEHPAGRYALNPAAVDIDLWAMRAALTEADTAATPAARTAALRRAVAAYPAPLAEGCDYEWIEPHREAIRRQALDAHLALADALADTPADALAVLTAAIGHDPYAEAAYQQAMRAHAALGQPDAIRALRRTLTRRLEEIDAEPNDDTLILANHLTTSPPPRLQSTPQDRESPTRNGRR
jgi:DNA-binding SARP family transcriptional activator